MNQSTASRLHHIDILRGLIILFMVLDHSMVFCIDYNVTDPMTIPGTDEKVFASRFLSHFCAPLFIFLSGLSAAMTEVRHSNSREFAKALIIRGLVLIGLEFTLVSWSWSFNPTYPMLYAQIIWAIGWGFIGLGVFRLMGLKAVMLMGVSVVFFHDLFHGVRFDEGSVSYYIWSIFHQKNVLLLPMDFKVRTTYPMLPVMGLMALAYMLGRAYVASGFSRQFEQLMLKTGVACIGLYSILRVFNLYGDPGLFTFFSEWHLTVMSFLNPTKYPLSLQFMLLTVGVGLMLLYFFAKLKVTFSQGFLQVLGKTSMFSYILHLYVGHLLSWILIPVFGFGLEDMTYGQTLTGLPEGFSLTYFQTCLFASMVIFITWVCARHYLPWKLHNKNRWVAKYI